ncbi:hypothetical protein GCM10023185_19920 [Hymenobacter saemangeumensis]|uniref:Transporter n=1 Tax=Hymenobacter saemangeumensis TaxID=1084522 RepID=A0ABP8ICW2_9BACT
MKTLLCLLLCLPAAASAQTDQKTSPYDSAQFSWRKPVPRQQLRDLKPDRPGVTESPFTVDAGHAQLEVDAFRLINSGSEQETREREFHVAYSMLKFGLSRNTDFHVELPVYSNLKQRPATASEWQDRNAGFGDLSLRLKQNFMGNDGDKPVALAGIAYVRLPTGGAAGRGGVEYGALLPLNVELSKKWNLEAQLEADLNYDRDEAHHYWRWQPSLAFDYQITKKLGLLAEGVARWESLQQQWQTALNLAPFLKLTDNLQLDAGTHLALDRQIDHEYFIGVTVRR